MAAIASVVAIASIIVASVTVINQPEQSVRQIEEVLPFGSEMMGPRGVATDATGAVYVADALLIDSSRKGRVLKLDPGANHAEVLPFPPLENAVGLAVADDGTVYVADQGANSVFELKPGGSTPATVPFDDLVSPSYLGLDGDGTLYAVEATRRAVRTYSRQGEQASYPNVFGDDRFWNGLAVESPGVVVVSTYAQTGSGTEVDVTNPAVTKVNLKTGQQQTLPVTGLHQPTGLAFDHEGNLFVCNFFGDFGSVIRFSPSNDAVNIVPFGGGIKPDSIAVDVDGSLIVSDQNMVRRLSNYQLGPD